MAEGADRVRVLAALLGTRMRRSGSRAALERHQRRRLRTVLARARRVFPFYGGLDGHELTDFPVLDKTAWLAGFDALNDRGLTLSQCLHAAEAAEAQRRFDATLAGLSIGLSSGSSGRRGVFLTTPAERARWAGAMLARTLPGLREPARVALVLRAGGPLYEAVARGRVTFAFVDLALPPEELAARLTAFAPTVLAAPPRVLDDLAGRRVRPAPAVVYSIAEVLDDDVAARITGGFGVPVRQVYQATEGFLGITCGHGTLHLNEDLLLVEREVLDAGSGRFTPVITDLYRTSQAVVRYRLDDVLVPGPDECPCGSVFTAVARVEGRVEDVLRLPDAAGERRPVFGTDVTRALLGVPGVRDFRVVQRGSSLRLAVRPPAAQPAAHRALTELAAARGLAVPEISGMPWPVEARLDKVRRIRREA